MQEQLGLIGTAAVGKGTPGLVCAASAVSGAPSPGVGSREAALMAGSQGRGSVPLSPPSPTAPLLFSLVGGVSDLDFVQTKDSTAYSTITCSQTWRPGAGQGLAWVTRQSA